MPSQPNVTAKKARASSGMVMKAGLSWACSASAVRGLPRKVSEICRAV